MLVKMFKQPLKLYTSLSLNTLTALLQQEIRCVATAVPKEKWDLLSAVCLERHPVINKPMNEIEAKFQQVLHEIEYEKSMKSDHELKDEEQKNRAELLKKGIIDSDLNVAVVQSTQDFEDSCLAELNAFQFAPKITEADEKNITNTLDRKLDRNLVLLVEQTIGMAQYWIPPQGIRKEGETMRQTAERVLADACGKDLNVKFYGNAPIGFYKYKYPRKIRTDVVGAKIFFFLAKYINGSITQNVQYQWLDRKELKNTMPTSIYKSVSRFLITETE